MFERLTMWTRYGYQIKGFSPIAYDLDIHECKVLGNAAARLAAYEDTGLTPNEVRELAEAKAEGRLVVLPCKVGDVVYVINRNKIVTGIVPYAIVYETFVDLGIKFNNYHEDYAARVKVEQVGKTIFITREEAEKALEARNKNEHNNS